MSTKKPYYILDPLNEKERVIDERISFLIEDVLIKIFWLRLTILLALLSIIAFNFLLPINAYFIISPPVLSYKKLQSILSNPYFNYDEINLEYKKKDKLEDALKFLQRKVVKSVNRGNIIWMARRNTPKRKCLW